MKRKLMKLQRAVGLLLLAALLFPTVQSCQKGENDPVFSLRTRKARLTGDWRVETANWSVGDTTWVLANGQLTKSYGETVEDPLTYSMDFGFEKDGTYFQETETSFPDDFQGNGQPATTETVRKEGNWNWAGGDDDTKTKSRLLLLDTKLTISSNTSANIIVETYSGQNEGFLYDIDKLMNDEMTLLYEVTRSTATAQVVESGEFELRKD